jgi:16S rRNA (cytidine1402-2'-O)-methyltransferase
VHAAIAAGAEDEVLPGPSSVLTALVASDLPSERWTFIGFLPKKVSELRQVLASATDTVVAFESPKRIGATLKALAELDPERPAAVCRELTKLHEEVVRGTAQELATRYENADVKGEIVLVFGGADAEAIGLAAALDALERLIDAGAKVRPAASVVAELTGVAANALYRAHTER